RSPELRHRKPRARHGASDGRTLCHCRTQSQSGRTTGCCSGSSRSILPSGCAVTPQHPRNRLPKATSSVGVLPGGGGLYSSAWSPVVSTFAGRGGGPALTGRGGGPALICTVAGHAPFTRSPVTRHSLISQ